MAMQNGHLSDLGLYYAPKLADTDVEYVLKVETGCKEADGNAHDGTAHIEAIVDGVSHETVEYRLPVVEELYYTASIENESGDLIVKAVNLKSEPISVELDIKENDRKYVDIWELSGYEKDAVNTFEEPMKVAPQRKCIELDSKIFTFAPESVTVLRLHK